MGLLHPSRNRFVEPQLESIVWGFWERVEIQVWEWAFKHLGVAELSSEGVIFGHLKFKCYFSGDRWCPGKGQSTLRA